MTQPDLTQTLWRVLRNSEGRFSLLHANHPIPAGWSPVGDAAGRADCLDRIGALWTDMRPLSVQEALK
ncbi:MULTISPECIES: MbtH family protein [Roseobacteraceae]|uniref:MbtH-like protein n=1 Tax=Pseudosulfitobacter pseudonitzschiae TaxID=1402135 RepID=A0A221JW88_9RHOB|nr:MULTISPECIES: MbtH family NRPS accessory protein [Roseobacteraceae]ASM71006.1 MbtH-like protein [Pseudosulfitobacter pseudonitzschiae]